MPATSSRCLGSGAGEVKPLKGVDLKLYSGELTLLMGPSGSGKTTLLSILGCILSPTEGQLEVAGNSTHGQDAEGLANLRRRHVGFVFQGYNLFPTMTASENVMLALDVRGKARRRPADARPQRADRGRPRPSCQGFPGQAFGRREAACRARARACRRSIGDPRRRADRGARRRERPRGHGAPRRSRQRSEPSCSRRYTRSSHAAVCRPHRAYRGRENSQRRAAEEKRQSHLRRSSPRRSCITRRTGKPT